MTESASAARRPRNLRGGFGDAWRDGLGDQVISSFCFAHRNGGGGGLAPSEECEAFSAIAGGGVLTADEARHVVTFFQELESTACPPRTYQDHGQDRCSGDLTDSSGVLVRREAAALQGSVSEGPSIG